MKSEIIREMKEQDVPILLHLWAISPTWYKNKKIRGSCSSLRKNKRLANRLIPVNAFFQICA